MKYKKIETGEKNATLINDDLLIDCGITKKETLEKINIDKLKYVLYTHSHVDHIDLPSFKLFSKMDIQLYMNADTYIQLRKDAFKKYTTYDVINYKNVNIIEPGDNVHLDDYYVKAYAGYHDVEVNIYALYAYKTKETLLYATDTGSYNSIPRNLKFDYMFLESNHSINSEDKIKEETQVTRVKMHMNHEDTNKFYLEHKKENSKLERMHMSTYYY